MTKDNSEYLIERRDNVYEVVIGLEVHAQVTSNSKLFSSSSTTFGAISAPVEHIWLDGARHDLKGRDVIVADAVAEFVRRITCAPR